MIQSAKWQTIFNLKYNICVIRNGCGKYYIFVKYSYGK